MNAKDLHPGLGSGALREALEELCSMWETEKETELPTERSRWYEMALVRCARDVRRALSLSSPIERAICGVIGYPEQGKRVCELLAGHDDYHMQGGVRWLGYHAAPTPQASSEVREALTQRITDYLTAGGLFNAEMALHDRVRDLLIDCRDALA